MTGTITDLHEKALKGAYFEALDQNEGNDVVNALVTRTDSNSASETYSWLNNPAQMRVFDGQRQIKKRGSETFTISNTEYESTEAYSFRDLSREKTGQLDARIGEHVARANSHEFKLLVESIEAGLSSTCYDGQFFFDTDHTEGNNTTSQSNDITVDISALPAETHGTITAPSIEEVSLTLLEAIEAMLGFKDNENEPMNESLKNVLVMVPHTLSARVTAAVGQSRLASGADNPLMASGMNITVVGTPRLTDASRMYLFNTDGRVKPFILQEESSLSVDILDRNSDHAKLNREIVTMLHKSQGIGYGLWQKALTVDMV